MNIPASIPALSNKDFSHLDMVDEYTCLCGLTTARNNSFLAFSNAEGLCLPFIYLRCLLWAKPCIARENREEELALSVLMYMAWLQKYHGPTGVCLRYHKSRSGDLDGLAKVRIIQENKNVKRCRDGVPKRMQTR